MRISLQYISESPPICLRPTGTLAKRFGVSSVGAQCKRIAGEEGLLKTIKREVFGSGLIERVEIIIIMYYRL